MDSQIKRNAGLAIGYLLNIASATIAAITNADTLINDIHKAFPWTAGDCDIWSGSFLVLMAAVAVLSFVIVRATAGSDPRAWYANAALIFSGLLFVYWAGVATLGGATCTDN
jgi:hypothetical protein